MISVLGWIAIVLWAVAAGFFSWYVYGIAKQITYVTLADGRRQERAIPLIFRLLLPLAPNLASLAKSPGLSRMRTRADAMLVTAGFEGLLSGWEFIAIKILMPLCVGPVFCLIFKALCIRVPILDSVFPLLCVVSFLLPYVYPMSWLTRSVNVRQKKILKAMPFVLDLLTLSVEAGLDFMSAVQRTTEREKLDPLSEELLRMVREIQVGASRRDALKAMARRIDLPDMRSLVNALVQADELGVAIGAILRIQSDQIRNRRFERAEKLANEAPTKLLGPLVVFIFPAVFIILLGPLLFKLVQQV